MDSTVDARDRYEDSPSTLISPSDREDSSEGESVLDALGLRPEDTRKLSSQDRSRLLNFLLRWECLRSLHSCLDILIPARPVLVSLQDLRAKELLARGRL